MNEPRLTDARIASALRAYLPTTAQPGLRSQILAVVQTTHQDRRLPSFLGLLAEADFGARRRNLLVAAAFLLALALATSAVVGALLMLQREDPLDASRGLLAFTRQGDLYLANPNGTDVVEAAHVDGIGLSRPTWSPDGRSIALQTDEPAVLQLDTRTLALRRLADGYIGAWSPDGQSLAIVTPLNGIVIVDVPTGERRELTRQPVAAGQLIGSISWSPDGRWLATNTCCAASHLVRIDVASGQIVELGSLAESEYGYELTWSPDSQRIAFVKHLETRSQVAGPLMVMDVDGTHRTEIAPASEGPGDPLWSPDGRRVAYSAVVGGGSVDYPRSVMVVRPDGSDRRQLADGIWGIVGWSPDGASIAFTVTRDAGAVSELREITIADGSSRTIPAPEGATEFAWAVVPASQPTPVLPAQPAMTAPPPDEVPAAPPVRAAIDPPGPSHALAFSARSWLPSGEPQCDVLILRLPDRVASVVPDPGAPGRPSSGCTDSQDGPGSFTLGSSLWSPDGSAYARVVYGSPATVEIVGKDGVRRSGPTPIAPNGSFDPKWSPDGTWFSAAGCPGTAACAGGYFIVRPDGTDLRQLPGRPAWSQDGRRLAVETADGTLLVGRPDGTDLNAIGSFPLPAGWAPDGEEFAFVRDGNVWIANADGSGVRNLTNFDPGGATDASWSPDGSQIAVRQGSTIWVFDPVGTGQRRLGGGYSPDQSLDWSPDGARLVVTRDQDLVLFKAGAWHPVLLANGKGPVWAPDGRYLAVVSTGLGSGDSIDLMNADGSAAQSVWRSPDNGGGTVESMVWVP